MGLAPSRRMARVNARPDLALHRQRSRCLPAGGVTSMLCAVVEVIRFGVEAAVAGCDQTTSRHPLTSNRRQPMRDRTMFLAISRCLILGLVSALVSHAALANSVQIDFVGSVTDLYNAPWLVVKPGDAFKLSFTYDVSPAGECPSAVGSQFNYRCEGVVSAATASIGGMVLAFPPPAPFPVPLGDRKSALQVQSYAVKLYGVAGICFKAVSTSLRSLASGFRRSGSGCMTIPGPRSAIHLTCRHNGPRQTCGDSTNSSSSSTTIEATTTPRTS